MIYYIGKLIWLFLGCQNLNLDLISQRIGARKVGGAVEVGEKAFKPNKCTRSMLIIWLRTMDCYVELMVMRDLPNKIELQVEYYLNIR